VARLDQLLNPATAQGRPQAGIKLVRGSHIVVPRLFQGEHAYILQNDDRRIVFMIPYQQRFTLIGTTDVPQADMTGPAQVSQAEERYLLQAVNRYLERALTEDQIVWRYAGVRALFADEADDPSALSRDYQLVLDDSAGLPCVSVYGGKITTYRRLAESVLDQLAPWLQKRARRGPWSATEALPGARFARAERAAEVTRLQQKYPQLDAAFLAQLFDRHGTRSYNILREAQQPGELGHDFGGGLCQREVEYLVVQEWAGAAEDVLWRRTKCGLHMSPGQRAAFSDWFARRATRCDTA